MDKYWEDYRKKAKDLEYRVHDLIDDHNHPEARVVKEEFRRLTEDFEQKRNPRSIEARMQTIQRQLHQAQNSPNRYMDVRHAVDLHHNIEHMRVDMRKWPHY